MTNVKKNNQFHAISEKIHRCAATDSFGMLELMQEYLEKLLDADKVTWYAVYKGEYGRENWHTRIMNGWKVVDIKFPRNLKFDKAQAIKNYYKQAKDHGDVDPQVQLGIESAGQTRVHLLHDAITPEEWSTHWMKRKLARYGVGERMPGAYTLSNIAESYFLIDRGLDAKPFTLNDKHLFLEALIKFPRLHYWLFLERGLVEPAKRPFSPREKEIVKLLLGPQCEKDIAASIKLAKGTTHNYITAIYKNLGVKSRCEMVQLWLGVAPI